MKKFFVALLALAVATSVATAGVGILWTTVYGAYDHNAPDTVGGSNALLDSYGALWQLIYAGADNTANRVDWQNGVGGPGIADDYVAGDDVVWAQRTIAMGGGTAPEDGTDWSNWMTMNSGDNVYQDLAWSTAGFVYQRVFETPISGVWPQSYYYESPLLALDTTFAGGTASPQDFALDTGNSGFRAETQIPEPATMGLLGLGALVMAIRRRRS